MRFDSSLAATSITPPMTFQPKQPLQTKPPLLSAPFVFVNTCLLFIALVLGGGAVLAHRTIEQARCLAWQDGAYCAHVADSQGADNSNYLDIALKIRSQEETWSDAPGRKMRDFK